jgi:hypothetical protein
MVLKIEVVDGVEIVRCPANEIAFAKDTTPLAKCNVCELRNFGIKAANDKTEVGCDWSF